MYGIPDTFSLDKMQRFSQSLQRKTWTNAEGIQLTYHVFQQPQSHALILILPGRTEHGLLYMETLYDLVIQGFDVLILDHRGQGFSERALDNPHIGYVDSFDSYTRDTLEFLDQHMPKTALPQYLLAHSMGGAIALDILMKRPEAFQAAVLVAPMLDILLPLPKSFLRSALRLWANIMGDKHYVPMGKDYEALEFSHNIVTRDKVRYLRYIQTFEKNPTTQIGAPSSHWVFESLQACESLLENKQELKVPCLMFQAEDEKIVLNAAQDKFAEDQEYVTIEVISKAYHQILIEETQKRNQLMHSMFEFFKKHR